MDTLFPWLHTSNNVLESYIIYILVVTLIGSAGTVSQMCDVCLNNSTCSIITHIDSNVSTVHCICPHGWFGHRCESRANLILVSVTMTSATLRWDLPEEVTSNYLTSHDDNRSNGNSAKMIQKIEDISPNNSIQLLKSSQSLTLRFSIFYWVSNRRQQCNIVPNLTTQNVSTISGLTEDTQYIFCANIDYIHTCDFNLVNHDNNKAACVYVTTERKPSVPTVYVILVSCVACVGIFILLVILGIAKRKDFLPMLICVKDTKTKVNHRTLPKPKMPSSSDEDHHTDISLYRTMNTNQTISVHPPNCPGKPQYQLKHKRMRGYASFTARNEQTIPLSTVLEYTIGEPDIVDTDVDTDDEENVITETLLIEDSDE